jgi:hypothetical protein
MGKVMPDHIVWKHSLRAGKPFYPNGRDIPIRNFQDAFRHLRGKINVSLDVIRQPKYELNARTLLGRHPVTEVKELAVYLYDNTISPRLFAVAVNSIACWAEKLKGQVVQIQLRNLRRDHLKEEALQRTVKEAQLERNAAYFENLPIDQRLQVLEQLGVITLVPGHQLPARRTAQQEPDRRPPIERAQLDLDLFKKV